MNKYIQQELNKHPLLKQEVVRWIVVKLHKSIEDIEDLSANIIADLKTPFIQTITMKVRFNDGSEESIEDVRIDTRERDDWLKKRDEEKRLHILGEKFFVECNPLDCHLEPNNRKSIWTSFNSRSYTLMKEIAHREGVTERQMRDAIERYWDEQCLPPK